MSTKHYLNSKGKRGQRMNEGISELRLKINRICSINEKIQIIEQQTANITSRLNSLSRFKNALKPCLSEIKKFSENTRLENVRTAIESLLQAGDLPNEMASSLLTVLFQIRDSYHFSKGFPILVHINVLLRNIDNLNTTLSELTKRLNEATVKLNNNKLELQNLRSTTHSEAISLQERLLNEVDWAEAEIIHEIEIKDDASEIIFNNNDEPFPNFECKIDFTNTALPVTDHFSELYHLLEINDIDAILALNNYNNNNTTGRIVTSTNYQTRSFNSIFKENYHYESGKLTSSLQDKYVEPDVALLDLNYSRFKLDRVFGNVEFSHCLRTLLQLHSKGKLYPHPGGRGYNLQIMEQISNPKYPQNIDQIIPLLCKYYNELQKKVQKLGVEDSIVSNQYPSSKAQLFQLCLDMTEHFQNSFENKKLMVTDLDGNSINALQFFNNGVTKWLSGIEDKFRFQLKECFPILLKDVNPKYRSGLPYYPDGWQDRLIQMVDENRSVLVSAPTSAGKSFIAYYLLEKYKEQLKPPAQRKNSMASRIVFVVPTQTLCVQMKIVLLEKGIPSNLIAFSTKKARQYERSGTILLCTPGMLESFLLSPENIGWQRDLLYVVFDEVHNISPAFQNSDEEETTSYARIISLISCPFLALSASIRNEEEFAAQLSFIHQREVAIVPKRSDMVLKWVDSHFYIYDKSQNNANRFHPYAVLPSESEDVDYIRERIKILQISPLDLLEWLETINHVDIVKAEFENKREFGRIYREDCEKMKLFSLDLLSDNQLLEGISRMQEKYKDYLPSSVSSNDSVQSEKPIEVIAQELLQFFRFLHKDNKLPAIVFKLDIHFLDTLADALNTLLFRNFTLLPLPVENYDDVDEDEEGGRGGSSGNNNSNSSGGSNGGGSGRKINNNYQKMTANINNYKQFLHTLEQCKAELQPLRNVAEFQDIMLDNSKHLFWLKRMFKNMKTANWRKRNAYMRLLGFGIAFNHSHLPKPYRDLVEGLMRSNKCPVVIATSTLAQGLDVPCRSVVLLPSSRRLMKNLYLQMVGRAGRRGLDQLAHIIYYDLSPTSIKNLIFSLPQKIKLPSDINRVTPCYVLRIYNLYTSALAQNNLIFATRILVQFLSNYSNLFKQTKKNNNNNLYLSHSSNTTTNNNTTNGDVDIGDNNYNNGDNNGESFSTINTLISFFYRMHLINKSGKLIGLAGVITHCSDISPASFFLNYLFLTHYFDTIGKIFTIDRKLALKKMMFVLSCILHVCPRDGGVDFNDLPEGFEDEHQHLVLEAEKYNDICSRVSEIESIPRIVIRPHSEIIPLAYNFFMAGLPSRDRSLYVNEISLPHLAQQHQIRESDYYQYLYQFVKTIKKITVALGKMQIEFLQNNVLLVLLELSEILTLSFHSL